MSKEIIFFEDFLIIENILTPEELEKIIKYAKENRVNYIDIITKIFKLYPYDKLIEKISRFYHLELIDYKSKSPIFFLPKNFIPVNREVANRVEITDVMELQTFPADFKNGVLTLVSTVPYVYKAVSFYKDFFKPKKIEYIWTTEKVFNKLVENVYSEQIRERTLRGLTKRPLEETAYMVMTKGQALFFGAVAFLFVFGLYFDPLKTLIAANFIIQGFYILSIGFKLLVSLFGEMETSGEDIKKIMRNLKEEELPFYTILLPVYKEKEIVKLLLQGVANLDYPKERYEILILLEEDDVETIQEIENHLTSDEDLKGYNFIPIVVPDYQPKTKPKACNYGLIFSRGKHLVIYDAEDIPEPNQLKMAVAAFKYFPDEYICFQAHLNYYNTYQNFLTKMFTLEYSYWFDYMLPGLFKLNLPIPLGGTSNHFKMSKLIELGGWDPYNTTEDADLGMRAYLHGYKVGVIDSTTYEEANSDLKNWIRQRSRWIKGYMQTWLVYNRKPLEMVKQAGLKGYISFNMLIGGTPFIFLVNPIQWVIFLFWLVTKTGLIAPLFPSFVYYTALFNLILGNFLAIYLNMLPIFKRKLFNLFGYALLNPAYWVLHSIAAYKALWQLIVNPFYWEKTEHGLSDKKYLDEIGKLVIKSKKEKSQG